MFALPHKFTSFRHRKGGALVLVLVVLVSCAVLFTATQALLARRSVEQNIAAVQVELRGALLMALDRAAHDWAADADLTFDFSGESWAQARDLNFDNGVAVRITPRDAQDRYNINNLGLQALPDAIRPPYEVMADLLIRCGHFQDSTLLPQIQDWLDPDEEGSYEKAWLEKQGRTDRPANRPLLSLEELKQVDPRIQEWIRKPEDGPGDGRRFEAHLDEEIVFLPVPSRQVLPVNLNTVRPTVLRAIVGENLSAWVDTVVQARTRAPLTKAEFVTELLPDLIRSEVAEAVAVRSDYLELRLRAFYQNTPKEMWALLHRDADGNVEVLICRW